MSHIIPESELHESAQRPTREDADKLRLELALATVTAEREQLRSGHAECREELAEQRGAAERLADGLFTCDQLLQEERAAHAETARKLELETAALKVATDACKQWLLESESTRAELAKVTAEWDTFRERVIREAGTELEALVVTRAELGKSEARVQRALAYLTDKDDVESTPGHAIGHAVQELTGV